MANVRIESPEQRKASRFSPAEADAFMASWYRIVANDGSTIGYAPDETTAIQMADGYLARQV